MKSCVGVLKLSGDAQVIEYYGNIMNHGAVIWHSHADCSTLSCSTALDSLGLWAHGEGGTVSVVGDVQ